MAQLVKADTDCLQTGRKRKHKEVRISAQLTGGQGICPMKAVEMFQPEQNVLALFLLPVKCSKVEKGMIED